MCYERHGHYIKVTVQCLAHAILHYMNIVNATHKACIANVYGHHIQDVAIQVPYCHMRS